MNNSNVGGKILLRPIYKMKREEGAILATHWESE